MADNQEASVVHCVNETIREHTDAGVHDDWKMGADYGYEDVSIKLFLNSVKLKLSNSGFSFTYKDGFGKSLLPKTLKLSNSGFSFTYKDGFGKSLLPKTLEETKVAIDENTEER